MFTMGSPVQYTVNITNVIHPHLILKGRIMKEKKPTIDKMMKEAKASKNASKCGMFLLHNGVVRVDAKAKVREGKKNTKKVTAMEFSYDNKKVDAAIKKALKMKGIYHVKVWLNTGKLKVGDDIMLVLIGGDIRPHVVDCLQSLVGEIKSKCVVEKEIN